MKHAHTVHRKDTAARHTTPRLTPAARSGWCIGDDATRHCEEMETRRLVLLMESLA
jgi:hypothetical protein